MPTCSPPPPSPTLAVQSEDVVKALVEDCRDLNVLVTNSFGQYYQRDSLQPLDSKPNPNPINTSNIAFRQERAHRCIQ